MRELFIRETKETIASCNACYARNYDSKSLPSIGKRVDRLYEVHIGSMVAVLCADCLTVLADSIEEQKKKDRLKAYP